MKYGLPYKGSKNKLAERIVDYLPEGEHLIDLFCGGCAVTHRALLTGKYPHVHINDIDWRPVRLFEDALAGRYNDEDRWISREDFFRLKDTDPYVAVVWSFGNNMRDYLYSRQIEPLKRAIHYAMFYSDYEPGRLLGHDLSFIDGIGGMQERYLAVKQYFRRLGHFQQQSFEGGRIGLLASNMQRGRTSVAGTGGIIPPRTVKRPSELQHWEARQRMPNSKKKEPERLQSHEQRRDLLQIAVPRTSPLSARNGGGRNCLSHRLWATIATWRYQKAQSSTATSPTRERTCTTSQCSSTTTASTTDVHVRRNRRSSAATRCQPTASSAFRSSPIAARYRHRLTIG